MITGDNASTACYIAQRAGLIETDLTTPQILLADTNDSGVYWTDLHTNAVVDWDVVYRGDAELAVTGKAFNALLADGNMRRLLLQTRIFARMSPRDKVNAVKLHMVCF